MGSTNPFASGVTFPGGGIATPSWLNVMERLLHALTPLLLAACALIVAHAVWEATTVLRAHRRAASVQHTSCPQGVTHGEEANGRD